jgi:hypothetical protein
MTEKQEVTLKMLERTHGLCEENTDIISLYPPLQENYGLFTGKLESINLLAKNRAYDPTGITEDKYTAKEAMANLGSELARVGHAESIENNDHESMAYFDVCFSDIRYAPDQEAANTVKMLVDELRKIPAERLEIYITKPEDIDTLEGHLNSFTSTDREKSVMDATNVVATRDMARLFGEIKKLLEQKMDIQVSRLRTKHPDFVAKYEKAREVLGLSKSKHVETQDSE